MNEPMSDKEFEALKREIKEKFDELMELQNKYRKETGRYYYFRPFGG